MDKSSTRYAAAGLSALMTLAMLSSVGLLFDPAPAAATYASRDADSRTQVVVIQGKRLPRS